MMLTKDTVKTSRKKPELKTLDSAGEQAFIRHISGAERVRFLTSKDGDQLDAILGVMYFLGNEDGTRMFCDDERDAVEDMDGLLLQDIYLAGLRVNGLAEGDEESAVKKSDAAAT